MKKLALHLLTIILFLFISSCGGGSGGDDSGGTTANSDATFQLFPNNYFISGYSESYVLTGSDTAGGTYEGVYSIQAKPETTFNGTPAIPFSVFLELTNTQSGVTDSSRGTGYYSTSLDLIDLGFKNSTTGVITLPISTSPIPISGKIGDFGVIGLYNDSSGDYDECSWEIQGAGNGRAYLLFETTSTDQFGSLVSTTK
ncbi:hypothetical protein D1BOALGB6SA_2402 [Olavius sp. associated proteobacterium Delta 1]|nr:hypothetical protein D1BOALGB6SA_2402 [Olavius sp. associated proteobacterium Delta 1]